MPSPDRINGPVDEQWPFYLAGPMDPGRALHTAPSTVQFQTAGDVDSDIRNVKPGDGTVTRANFRYEIETGAADEAQALETGELGSYRAGQVGSLGIAIEKRDHPTGFAEWGYGGDGFPDEMMWRLRSDGSYTFIRRRDGVNTYIPRDLWDEDQEVTVVQDENGVDTGAVVGLDALDGTGPSGVDISTPVVTTFGMEFVLYGHGAIAPWVLAPDRRNGLRRIYPFIFTAKDESVLRQLNQPVTARIDNDGGTDPDELFVKERQFTAYGNENSTTRGTQHVNLKSEAISTPTAVAGFRRRNPSGPTRLDIQDTNLRVDNRAHVWWLIDPDVTANGADANWGPPVQDLAGNTFDPSETGVQVNDTIEVDPSTGVAVEGTTIEGGAGQNVTPQTDDFTNTPFVRGRPVVMMMEPFGGNDISTQEILVNVQEEI